MLTLKIEERIKDTVGYLDGIKYRTVASLSWEMAREDKTHRLPPENLNWRPVEMPCDYGEDYVSFWFRTRFTVPEEAGNQDLFLYARPQSDSMVFVDNRPTGALNLHHERLRIMENARPGESGSIHVESYSGHVYPGCHPIEGARVMITIGKTIPSFPNQFLNGEIQVKRPAAYALHYAARTLYCTALELDASSLRRAQILQGLFDALITIPRAGTAEEAEEACKPALESLKELLSKRNGDTVPEIHLIGHAHIDHAWLWPIAETDKKAARTFASMCRYAEEFPEFIFLQSHPAQLESVRKNYPAVYEDVRKAYARGQWEPNGGMWVEADCNIPSGESFIRQFLYGRKATRELLDYTGNTLWLPDVFGYSAALPQILKICGIDYFITSKINWNDTTRFPYDKFVWKGIDGTGVQTLFIPDCPGGYNGSATPENIGESWKNIQHKEIEDSFIKPIGEGDGGGGTHRSDLESARLMANLEGTPKVSWNTLENALKKVFPEGRKLPDWHGELYLELHRGTYTTQSRTKRFNRRIEQQLSRIESIYALLRSLCTSAISTSSETPVPEIVQNDPSKVLEQAWKDILTLQFHDIIPGSSVRRVYEDAEETYASVERILTELEEAACKSLASNTAAEDGLTLWNPTGFGGRRTVFAPADDSNRNTWTRVETAEGSVPAQSDTDLNGLTRLAFPADVPAMGWTTARLSAPAPENTGESVFKLVHDSTDSTVSTPQMRLTLHPEGGISSLVLNGDGFEYVPEGKRLNTFISAEDTPIFWDAWDIDADYRCKEKNDTVLISWEVVSSGPVLMRIRSHYRLGRKSEIVQDMILYADSPQIDFQTRVDWKERRTLLKTAFPVSIQTNEVRGDIQFGHVARPTHENRMEDRARFEVCAHKWMSLSDALHTAAVLNDCKYGWDVRNSEIRLTLLRAPEAPDEKADEGVHEFTYSFLPQNSPFHAPAVNARAYNLNQPVKVIRGIPGLPALTQAASSESTLDFRPVQMSSEGIVLETVKTSEDGESLVLRLYESQGAAQTCRITPASALNIESAEEVNALEDSLGRDSAHQTLAHGELTLEFHPFEIKTVKLHARKELQK